MGAGLRYHDRVQKPHLASALVGEDCSKLHHDIKHVQAMHVCQALEVLVGAARVQLRNQLPQPLLAAAQELQAQCLQQAVEVIWGVQGNPKRAGAVHMSQSFGAA